MKKEFFVCLVVMALLLVACQSSELPPDPGKPGTGQAATGIKTGAAVQYVPEGYAPPQDVFNNDIQIFFLSDYVFNIDEDISNINLGAKVWHQGGYLYKYGYYYSQSQQKWIQFEYSGSTVSGSNWIKDGSSAYVSINTKDIIPGENYVVSYSCKKYNNQWKCGCRDKYNCGYWMLNTFVYRKTDLPPEPELPGSPITLRAYISPTNQIVEQNDNITLSLSYETSYDISKEIAYSFPLSVYKPNGEKEVITLEKQGDIYCNTDEKQGKFSCNIWFSGNYVPSLLGEYRLNLSDAGTPPDYVRIFPGSFKSHTSEKIDSAIIRKGIGDFKFSDQDYLGWYNGWYGDVFYAYYWKDYFGASANIYTGDNIKWLFEDWITSNRDRLFQQKINVDGVDYIVNAVSYEYQYGTNQYQKSAQLRWLSNNLLVDIYLWADNNELDDLKIVVEEYLRKYPAEPINITQTCTDSDGGKNYYVDGSATGVEPTSKIYGTSYDYCENPDYLQEAYCGYSEHLGQYARMFWSYKCPNGCRDDACIKEQPVKIETLSNKLNLYEPLNEVIAKLSKAHTSALNDGSFRGKSTETYSQEIGVPSSMVEWAVDTGGANDPDFYLKFKAGQPIFKYRLRFASPAVSDIDSNNRLEDFEGQKLEMLGKEYTIVKAEKVNNNAKLTMFTGDIQDTLEEGQYKTYSINGKEYGVSVKVVSVDTTGIPVTKLQINNEVTKSLAGGETYTLVDGTILAVKQVLLTKPGDTVKNLVEFYLGAEQLILDGSNQQITVNDMIIDDAKVGIEQSLSTTEFKMFIIGIDLTAPSDRYLGKGYTLSGLSSDEAYDQLLTALGIDWLFGGMTTSNPNLIYIGRAKYTDTQTQPGNKIISFEFTNAKGIRYKFPAVFLNESYPFLGKNFDERLINNEGYFVCNRGMFIVESNNISRALSLVDINTASDIKSVRIKDIGTGETADYVADANGNVNIILDGYTYKLLIPDTGCVQLIESTDDSDMIADLWTDSGYEIRLTEGAGQNIMVVEPTQEQGRRDRFSFGILPSPEDGSATITQVDKSGVPELQMITLDSNSNISEGYTKYGTMIMKDISDLHKEVTIGPSYVEFAADVYFIPGSCNIQWTCPTAPPLPGPGIMVSEPCVPTCSQYSIAASGGGGGGGGGSSTTYSSRGGATTSPPIQ